MPAKRWLKIGWRIKKGSLENVFSQENHRNDSEEPLPRTISFVTIPESLVLEWTQECTRGV